MNKNAEMLNYIYKNASMGVYTVKQTVCMAKNEDFRKVLESQLEEYKAIVEAAKELLNKHGFAEQAPSFCKRLYACMMLNIETTFNNTDSKIAEMMLIGSNMGIVKALKNLKKHPDTEEDIKELMQRLLASEENNVLELKKYL